MTVRHLAVGDLDRSCDLLTYWATRHYDADARIENLKPMPGHAGISFGFDVLSGGRRHPLVVRVAPPGVRREGNRDVLRQVPVLQALAAEGVPVAPLRWWSADERWFGTPYFMVERLAGGSLDCWEARVVDDAIVRPLFRAAVDALVAIHRVPWRERLPGWSEPRTLAQEVHQWAPTLAKGHNRDWEKHGLALRDRLLDRLPPEPEPGLVHGDYYSNNWVNDGARLLAVVDWEIAAIGPSLLDLGCFAMIYDAESWGPIRRELMTWGMSPAEIVALYEESSGAPVPDVNWYRALAAWRLSSIIAHNFRLHREGRRPDDTWEIIADSFVPMVDRAMELLSRRVSSRLMDGRPVRAEQLRSPTEPGSGRRSEVG